MQLCFVARSIDLEYHSATRRSIATKVTTEAGCSIQVARSIPDQTSTALRPVRASGETVQYSLVAAAIYLEYDTTAQPARCTAMMARVRGVSAAITVSAVMF